MDKISEENQTNKSAIAELNGTIEDLIDRYKILQESVENVPTPTAVIIYKSLFVMVCLPIFLS